MLALTTARENNSTCVRHFPKSDVFAIHQRLWEEQTPGIGAVQNLPNQNPAAGIS
jgi:hypothetical protein